MAADSLLVVARNRSNERHVVALGGIDVVYEKRLDGGGKLFGQDFVRLLEGQPVDRLAEWCAGPGFIGFSLYGHGLCKRLDLLDINPQAVAVAQETMRVNSVPGKVWLSDCFDDCDESFDLIVGNPPHCATDEILPWSPPITYRDPDWSIHRKFYSQVRDHLNPGGRVILQENAEYSSAEDFTAMIQDGGLEVEEVASCPTEAPMYYLVVRPA
jgi:16S rRNA G1207 methylase RsmC